MTFGEVGNLLQQKVHRNFEPRSSGRIQRKDCKLVDERQNYGAIHGRLSDELVTYNSTPERSPRLADDWFKGQAIQPNQAEKLTINLCFCDT